ncbi:C39 family peptidase [Methylohalobius crimeensis]|uniref:C39 family peptidase n=1 Tax=Methylohalobius crimeensis TaxID=244365 RepID=UPI0003B37336|nr:C39 family peptidase [Methylohalobius crimeensis]
MKKRLFSDWGWRGVVVWLALLMWTLPGQGRTVKSLLEMRHEHVVIQKWDLSCGAATLATLLNYQYGDSVSEKEVAKGLIKREIYLKNPRLVQIRQGFSLLDLKRYVDARGYKGVGYGKLDLEGLLKKAPMIVPLNLHGYNHFVVFRGMRGNRVLLADPAWGNRTMTVRRFVDAWIDYPQFGQVGFMVQREDGGDPPNQLAPRPEDFVMLR